MEALTIEPTIGIILNIIPFASQPPITPRSFFISTERAFLEAFITAIFDIPTVAASTPKQDESTQKASFVVASVEGSLL